MRDKCAELGVTFDSWQDGAGRVILAKRDDGSYACSIGGVVMSIPRQVGKTFLIGAIVFALCLLHPGTTVLWTAHRLRTADETFAKMQAFARRKRVQPHVAKVVLGSGDEEISFHNGSRILFGARERGFGRGFDNVDIEVFDESQILTENAIDDMVPAMNTAPNPLPIFVGTPPKPSDPSEVFTTRRKAVLAGEDTDTAYIEFSADPDADPSDRKQWAKANPSYPSRTKDTAILRMKRILTPESFLREALGIWDVVDDEPDQWQVIDADDWAGCRDDSHQPDGPLAWAVDAAPDGRSAAIACSDGVHVEVVDHRRGTSWVADRVIELRERWSFDTVHVDKGGPAGSLLEDFDHVGVDWTAVTLHQHAQACGALLEDITDRKLRHIGQEPLDTAAKVAARRHVTDVWLWTRAKSSGDISPLVAVTLARWASAQDTGGEFLF